MIFRGKPFLCEDVAQMFSGGAPAANVVQESPAAAGSTLTAAAVVCRGLGLTSAGVPELPGCRGLSLSDHQRELCLRKPFLVPSLRDGARLAVAECQNQFRHERWNCSTSSEPPLFGYELTSGQCLSVLLVAWSHLCNKNSTNRFGHQ